MSNSLSLSLVTEAIILDVTCNFDCLAFRKTSNSPLLDKLDLILETVINFADAFSEMFGEIIDNYCPKDLSEKEFIRFVIPRGLILCQKKTYFNFILACSFMSEIVHDFVSSSNCFHFAKLTWKCLLQIVKSEFEDLLERDNGWEGLLSFCEKMNRLVINQSVEKNISDNSLVNIKMDKSHAPSEESLIEQFSNFNIVDSNISITEDCRLQVNLKDVFINPDNLMEVDTAKQNIAQNTDIIEFVDTPQKLSNSPLFNETESTDKNGCDMTNKIEFLFELLTESSEHLNEILSLIDDCGADIDPDMFSLIEYEGLCGDKQMISTMVSKEMSSPQCDISISRYTASKSINILDDTLYEKKMASEEETGEHLISTSINTSAEDHSECSSDTGHFECLSSTAMDDEHCTCPSLNVSEDESRPVQCCELCNVRRSISEILGKRIFREISRITVRQNLNMGN
ncbi:hypothetical protein HNY73_004816 [Argiope bruennichi]|uniref:Uncharacterized protein n=1 Tax=Argiope bruennichi TaxID=94029 RepID=A0A8T0FWY5_ARGBR|nr:hypothetical protein HNY73_004816 [Argiope bruennichi]